MTPTSIIKSIIRNLIPYGVMNHIQRIRDRKFIDEYKEFSKLNHPITFDERPNYKTIITVQGFGYSGSGAIIDLLREYDECNVLGYVDVEGSLTKQQLSAGEMDFMRHSGGIFEIEKYITDNNAFINDSLLHRFLKLISVTPVCQTNIEIKHLFYTLFNNLVRYDFSGISSRIYNSYLLPQGESDIFFLNNMSVHDYRSLIKDFLRTLVNKLNPLTKEFVVLDQFLCDFNFDIDKYLQYIPDSKFICVYRDPRDVYTFAVKKNVIWIPHNSVEDFIQWCKIMYGKFDVETDRYFTISFEKLVSEYDRSVDQLEKYIGISNSYHINPKTHFDPAISKNNIGIWMKNTESMGDDYMQIKNELNDYCYEFDNI